MVQSTHKQSDAGTLTETMITEVKRNTRTVSCKMSSLFVKKNITNITKLETKIIRKTQYAENHFNAEALKEALEIDLKQNRGRVSCKTLTFFVRD